MATTQEWLDEAAHIKSNMLAGGGTAGFATREMVSGLTGMQTLEAMLAGKVPFASIAQTLDYMLIAVSEGEAVFQGSPTAAHLNPMGGVHGGWYGTLLDSAMGCAVHTLMPVGRGYTTAEYSVNLVKAVKPGGVYRTLGKVLHCGKQLATAEARIVDADGKLYAHATTTCLVFELPSR
jgi:uncharacterized protein (TIGR00369 family)